MNAPGFVVLLDCFDQVHVALGISVSHHLLIKLADGFHEFG